MLRIGEGRNARYVGLLPDVSYRVELGFAFVDDGDRLFKMQLALFEQAVGVRATEPGALSGVTAFVEQHKTVFTFFDTSEEASRSLVEKAI